MSLLCLVCDAVKVAYVKTNAFSLLIGEDC